MTAGGKGGRGVIGALPPCPRCGAPWHEISCHSSPDVCAHIAAQPAWCTCGDPIPDPLIWGGCGRCHRPVVVDVP